MRAIFPALALGLICMGVASCAHHPGFLKTDSDENSPPVSKGDSEHDQISKLQEKIQDLETRLGALNDKINLENGVANSSSTSAASNTPSSSTPPPHAKTEILNEEVDVPPAHAKVIPHVTSEKKTKVIKLSGNDAASRSEAIDRFREAKILYDSKRFSDAVLEFSEFVKNEPEHPLASAAQYYVGMSYFNQKEYKLAEEEFSRGLLSYPHSSYTPDTLLALSKVSISLKKQNKVTYYREKLLSSFPNSPQAKKLDSEPPPHAPQTAPEMAPETAPESTTEAIKKTPAVIANEMKAKMKEEMKSEIEPSVVESKEIAVPEVPKLAEPQVEGENQ